MIPKLRHVLLLAGLSLPAAASSTAEAQSATGGASPTGILKMHGYRDIAELSCAGNVYRFEVSRVEGRFIIDIDSRTGNIVRRQQL
jgi:hypothetical protein